MRLREQQQNQLLRQQPLMAGQVPLNMRRNGMVPPNLQKTVLQNNTAGLYVLRHPGPSPELLQRDTETTFYLI